MNMLYDWAQRHNVSAVALQELAQLYAITLPVPEGKSESYVQSQLRLMAPKLDASLWRNNSGAMLDTSGRMVRYGLGNDSKRLNDEWKSPDLVGITRVNGYGVFTAVEVKPEGWRGPSTKHEHAQSNFLQTVEALGGIGMFATSVNDYRARIRR